MTEKGLQNIKFLRIEIERCEKILKELHRERGAEEYERVLMKSKADLIFKKAEAENLIDSINDDEIRLIFKLKFVDLKSWNYIANKMHYDRTTIYKKYRKYLEGLTNEQ